MGPGRGESCPKDKVLVSRSEHLVEYELCGVARRSSSFCATLLSVSAMLLAIDSVA